MLDSWRTKYKGLTLSLIEVGINSFGLMLFLGLFGYNYNIRTYTSSIALYFVLSELKYFMIELFNGGNK